VRQTIVRIANRKIIAWRRKKGKVFAIDIEKVCDEITKSDGHRRFFGRTTQKSPQEKAEHGTGEAPCSAIITSVPRYQKGGRTCVQVVPGKMCDPYHLPYSLVSAQKRKS